MDPNTLPAEWIPAILVALFWLAGMLLYWLSARNPDAAAEYGLLTWARILVGAAEQLYDDNDTKLRYVLERLAAKFPELDADDLRAALEWAVHELGLEPRLGVIDVQPWDEDDAA